MLYIIALAIGIILGYFIGRQDRVFLEKIKELQKNIRKEPTGVTPGIYHKANENNVNQTGETGFTTPKTPQRLEWEE